MTTSNRGGWPAAALLAAALGGCGGEAGPAPAGAPSGAPVAASPEGRIGGDAGIEALRRRAHDALAAHRLHAPAGDNAAEHFLALQARAPGDAAARDALVGLQPYVLIAAEQALAGGDAREAARLVALLERIDPEAPALPRLAVALETLPAAQAALPPSVAVADAPAAVAGAPSVPAARDTGPRPPADNGPPQVAAREPAPPAREVAPVPAAAPPAAAVAAVAADAAADPPPRPGTAAPAVPALLQDHAPRYPLIAMNRRLEGHVVVALTIGPDGRVSRASVTASQPSGVFDRAALAAAERWRFEATGRTHATTRTLRFSLDQLAAGDDA